MARRGRPGRGRPGRRPEPLPHARQPADQRLTGGHALLLALVLAGVLSVVGPLLAGWLAG